MLNSRLFHLVKPLRLGFPILRQFHHEFTTPEEQKPSNKKEKPIADADPSKLEVPAAVGSKYMQFRDEDATEILDVEEERMRYKYEDVSDLAMQDHYEGLNLNRGMQGVFDIEDLVEVLRRESAEDIFVCSVNPELKYVDYMVVCSARSYRHMLATAEFVRRMYKIKRTQGDILPKIEGEKSKDWMAMDLGNIALHIFSPRAREEYDLESLWGIGSQFDKEMNKPQDPLISIFENHSNLLTDFTVHNANVDFKSK